MAETSDERIQRVKNAAKRVPVYGKPESVEPVTIRIQGPSGKVKEKKLEISTYKNGVKKSRFVNSARPQDLTKKG